MYKKLYTHICTYILTERYKNCHSASLRPSLIDLHAPMVANRLNHAGQSPCYSGPVSRAHRVGHARAHYIGEVHEAKARIDSDILYHNDKRDDTCVPTIWPAVASTSAPAAAVAAPTTITVGR